MKISVITATFNAVETLPDCLLSVASQSYDDVEHWIIDGGSSDGTEKLARAYTTTAGGFISEPDNGIYDALNKGLARVSGDVVGFLHADDVYANKEVLSKVASIFSNPSVDCMYGDLVYVGRTDVSRIVRLWRPGTYDRRRLARGWMPPHPTFYARRSVYEQLGGFDTSFRIAADYDCMMRIFSVGNLNALYLPEIMIRMRLGGLSNNSLRNIMRKSLEDLSIMRKYRLGYLNTLLWKNFGKLTQFWNRDA